MSDHATYSEENRLVRFPAGPVLSPVARNLSKPYSGLTSNTKNRRKSNLRSLLLRNRPDTDPYVRWCGGGGS
jgi:hypothetical protein